MTYQQHNDAAGGHNEQMANCDNALSTGCVPLNVLDLQSIEDLQRRDGVNDRQSIIRFFCYWILI